MAHPQAAGDRDRGGPRSAVVVNPSKVDDVAQRRRSVSDALLGAGWPDPAWFETTPEDPGFGQARQAVDDGAEVVFAYGGDGTVMACVGALVDTDAALAILPAGTGNLLAVNFDVPTDLMGAIAVATGMARRRIDVGEAEGRCFAVMAGMGFDAETVGRASADLKRRIGAGAYILSGLQRARDRSMRVTIRLDDDQPLRRRARTVIVANVGKLQGGLQLFQHARPDDGLLDVAIISPRSLWHWLRLTWAIIRRRERIPHMQVLRAARVEVASRRDQPRQLDGDEIGPTRNLEVSVRPDALQLCVPSP